MAEATVKRERTCIGCGSKADKTRLFRIVRRPDRSVAFDATGRAAGRGAYVCSPSCLGDALKAGKLQRALRTSPAPGEVDRAVSEIEAASAACGS